MPNMEEFRASLRAKIHTARFHQQVKRDGFPAMATDSPLIEREQELCSLRYDDGYFLGLAHGLERALEMSQDVDE